MFADVRLGDVHRRLRPGRHGERQGVTTALGLLLLLGACGKSAQLPLQSWLLDAMEGPTPVSALIHAATMVTAGVYLIVRSGPIFDLSSNARLLVTIVGAATLLFGAIISCAKDDIKKALAGSTDEPDRLHDAGRRARARGYAFAIALLLAHGFFKAGLFLGAGSIKHEMNDEVDMRRFGGLRKVMPVTFVTFRDLLPGDHRHSAVLRLLRQGHASSTPRSRPGGTSGWILGLAVADRGRHHRVLHDPGDVHDLRRGAPVGERCPPARGAAGDDLADGPARDRRDRVRRLRGPQRPAGSTSSAR